jgi:hypothetical protein
VKSFEEVGFAVIPDIVSASQYKAIVADIKNSDRSARGARALLSTIRTSPVGTRLK